MFQDNLGKPTLEWLNHSRFYKARDDEVTLTLAPAGPYVDHLHFAPDNHLITQVFAGRMLFLTPDQQCQSTEGKKILFCVEWDVKV